MDRLFAQGTVNAAQSGDGPLLFLFHSLLSDRASFDAIAPTLSRSFRVLVPVSGKANDGQMARQ